MFRALESDINVHFGYESRQERVVVAPKHAATVVRGGYQSDVIAPPVSYAILPSLEHAAMPVCEPTSVDNFVDGVQHRIGRDKPGVTLADKLLLADNSWEIQTELFDLTSFKSLPFEEWLGGTNYNERRKSVFRKIHESASDWWDCISTSSVNAFIKKERFAKFKNARIIASRDDIFKCFVAPFFKALEHVVFARPEFIKHIPVHARAQYVSNHFSGIDPYWTIYENDHTSFETHSHTTFDCLEFGVYGCADWEMADAISDLLCGRQDLAGKLGGGSVRSRMSGEMNTSLGNGLSNMLSTLSIARIKYGERWREIKVIIEGDDGIFAFPPGMTITSGDFERFGFDVKLRTVESVGEAGFCSTYFLPDGSAAVIEPMKVIGSLSDSLTYKLGPNLLELQRSKALAIFYEYAGVPILSALGERLHHFYGEPTAAPTGDWYEQQIFRWAEANPHRQDRAVCWNSRCLFDDIFGWPPLEQIELEAYIKSAQTPVSKILHHPAIAARVPQEWVDYHVAHGVSNEWKKQNAA